MSKNNENKLVPKLRFPEFSNKESWKLSDLIKTADKKIKWSFTGGPFGSNLKAEDYTENGIRIIQLQNIGDGEFINDYKIYTSVEKADELLSCNIYSGEIILSKMGDPVGRACIIPNHLERCLMASDGIRLVVDEKKYSKFFVFSLINSKQIRVAIERKSTGSTRKRIGLVELKKIQLPTPVKLEEQQKIASCLSSLDGIITAESQKLEILQDHKKGLLQNLLPQEGETTPKFRFKEFQNSGEWVFDAFSAYIKLYRGSSPRPIQNYFTTDESGVNWIKIGDTKNADNFIIKQVEERITPEGAEKSRKVNVGELILANSMSYGKTYQLAIEGYIYDGWFVLREFEKHFDKQFLIQLLNSEYMQRQYKKLSAGGIVQNISSDIVYNTVLPHTSVNEQKRIASCLSSLDEIIFAQSQKVETLKLHKKGLLQGLFPTISNE